MHMIHHNVRMEFLGPVAPGSLQLPMMATTVCAGFPSPADDWIEDDIDLQRLLGVTENTVSLQLRGRWQTGETPRYVKTVILAWERLPPAAREELLASVEETGAE